MTACRSPLSAFLESLARPHPLASPVQDDDSLAAPDTPRVHFILGGRCSRSGAVVAVQYSTDAFPLYIVLVPSLRDLLVLGLARLQFSQHPLAGDGQLRAAFQRSVRRTPQVSKSITCTSSSNTILG